MMLRNSQRSLRFTSIRSFAAAAGGRVNYLRSNEAYQQLTKKGTKKNLVVYFTAQWCPPCKRISPVYEELSTKYKDIEFAKVDVDELNDTAMEAGVSSMPTFYLFQDGNRLSHLSFVGADEALLRENIKKLDDL